ncbi:Superoxide dismutase [Mn] [bioreactor metagenome]|uniref:superoxide dismutase n=1 Tax=bioreactor metagenome TaxID=1076179 RepID=A0A645J090_9ZZZZ
MLKNAERFRGDVRTSVIDNGGGVYNHNLYFEILSPSSNAASPHGNLGKAINRDFGSFDKFKEEFNNCAKKVFGSGYTFLVKDSRGFLKIVDTPDQITPITCGLCPLLPFDLWEHAYYLQYLNRRDEYIENLWKIINWNKVQECYMQ